MRRLKLLVAILAALVTALASASFGNLGTKVEDGSGPVVSVPTSQPQQLDGQPAAGTTTVPAGGTTTLPAGTVATLPNTTATVQSGPVIQNEQPTDGDRQYLETTAYNMNKYGQAAQTATTPGQVQQVADALDHEVQVTNQYLVERHIIRQPLAPSQLLLLLRKLGYWGGATWGRTEVDYALRSKILQGRTKGATVDSSEWKQFLTREEFAVGLSRTLGAAQAYTDRVVSRHDSDPNAHAALWAALEARMNEKLRPFNMLAWILGLLALMFLIGLVRWIFRLGRGTPAPAPAPPAPMVPPAVPPVAPPAVPPAIHPAVPDAPAPPVAPVVAGTPPAPFVPVTPAQTNQGMSYARS